jgi:hypothetical protein
MSRRDQVQKKPEEISTEQQNQQQQLTQQQIHALQRQQALRRALKDANSTQEVADDTSTRLATQGEQISRISRKLDGMEQDLKTADYHTTTIGSWFGQMWNAIRGQPKADEESKPSDKASAAADVSVANQAEQQRLKGQAQQDLMKKRMENDKLRKNNSNSTTTTTTTTTNQEKDEHERIEDDLLDQLHATVTGVMHSAKLQNSTIRAQNAALEETNDKMDKVDSHMRQTTKKINRLI